MNEHPPNGIGAGKAPIPNILLNSLQNNSALAVAQACEHKNTVTVREPPGRTYFSKEICIVCGTFLRWLPKPANVERRTLNSFKVAKLAMRPDLMGWERQFIRSVSQRRKISPRQQEILDALCAKYLEGKAQ